MKIGVLTPSLSHEGGGLFDSVRRLSQELLKQGASLRVYSLIDSGTAEDASLWSPLDIKAFPTKGPNRLGYSPALLKEVLERDHDVLITNGLWRYTSRIAVQWAERTGKGYLANPHGMLDAWALANSAFRKRVAGMLYENQHLRRARCIRALCDAEVEAIRSYGLRNPVCVIPNGIDLPAELTTEETEAPWQKDPEFAGSEILLYLGRLHPKKNLSELLRAWKRTNDETSASPGNWRLVIAGWDEVGYEQKLRQLAQELGLQRSIYFAGPLFGEAKAAAYRAASAFILPSLSEGLPMVVLEAWSYGLPVLMTSRCNLPEGFQARAAIAMDTSCASIAGAIRDLIALSGQDRAVMGLRGRQLCAERFNWTRIALQTLEVLGWICDQGARPKAVRDDV